MRAFVVVGPKPLGGQALSLRNRIKCMYIQPHMPDRSIEPLDIGILRGLAGLDIQQCDAMLRGPIDHGLTIVSLPVSFILFL